jgi:PKD repeat protein
MVNKTAKKIVFFVSFMLFINLISASAAVGNATDGLVDAYGPGETIIGWINLSLANEPTNSIFSNLSDEKITLIALLKKASNSGLTYTCNPASCDSDYSINNKESSKRLDINAGGYKLIAFNLTGTVGVIYSFKFNLASNNLETQKFPLAVDILNDGDYEWNAYSGTENFGEKNYGCLTNFDSTGESYISSTPYCQRIALTKSPRVSIGAEVNAIEGANFTLSIEPADGSSSTQSCTGTTIKDGVQEVSCLPEGSLKTDGNYFVCISTKNRNDDNKYNMSYEVTANPCGFAAPFSGTYSYNFKIFAEQATYAPNINFTLNNTELKASGSSVKNAEQYIKDYVSRIYNNNCSNGCIIPIKIYAGISQNLIVNEASMNYQSSGLSIITTDLYDAAETPAKISFPFQNLNIDEAGFTVPEKAGVYNISFYLDNTRILSKQINVGNIPSVNYVTPLIVAAKYPVLFRAGITAGSNITRYKWDFSDGTVITSIVPEMNHTYTTVGNYPLKITTTDQTGRNYTKTFAVLVESASEAIPDLLAEAEIKISSIQTEISTLSPFEKISLKSIFDVDSASGNITRLKSYAQTATTEAQYEAILKDLIQLRIPDGIGVTLSAKGLTYYPKADYADLDGISSIFGETYDLTKQQLYKEAIAEWDLKNTNTVLDYSELSSIYSDYTEASVKTFDITISYTGTEEAYAAIKDVEGIKFGADITVKKENGYNYIKLNNGNTEITFYATGDIDFSSLPMIISPALSKVTLGESVSEDKGTNKWAKFLIIVLIIVIVAAIIWVLLKIWYKKRYENYLFRNRNNLYNLVNYIKTSKEKGLSERDISAQLRKAGWNSEQVTYALKKYAGKETGMPEIQIGFKLKKNTDVNSGNKNLPK